MVRHATAPYVPEKIRARTDKMGFTSPQEVWQRRLLEPWLRAGIDRVELGFLDRDRVRAGFDDYLAGARDRPFLLVPGGVLRLVAGISACMSSAAARMLLIAYKFPPYAGVGGFRWAKLSKYLARLGHEIHVVSVPWPAYGPNTLMADAAEPGVTVHPIPLRLPSPLPASAPSRSLEGRGALCGAAGARRSAVLRRRGPALGAPPGVVLRAADRRAGHRRSGCHRPSVSGQPLGGASSSAAARA